MSRRNEIIRALSSPQCARRLSERTKFNRKTVETILARLEKSGIAQCLTPNARQSRLYVLTPLGRLMRRELVDDTDAPVETPDLCWDLLAWIEAGTYRRLVLKHLTPRQTPKQLRQAIVEEHDRIGMNHVHAVLRDFRVRQLAAEKGGTWALTALGEEFKRLTYPEMTAVNRTATHLWERLPARSAGDRAARE